MLRFVAVRLQRWADIFADWTGWCRHAGHHWHWAHPQSTEPVCRNCGKTPSDLNR